MFKEILVIIFDFINLPKSLNLFFLALHAEEEHELSKLNDESLAEHISDRSFSINTTSTCSTQLTMRESMYLWIAHSIKTSVVLLCLVTNTNKNDMEAKIKSAMINIMCYKSVIFTKSDLTHICGSSTIRLEAVGRLEAAGLIQHDVDYWVKPSRAKKSSKKQLTDIVKEGWIK